MYRRILVPIDSSPTSTRALGHALALAKSQGAHVRIVNVLDERLHVPVVSGFPVGADAMLESMRTTGQAALVNASALALDAGVEAETAMIESAGRYVSEIIVEDAYNSGADLIVMGTHGRRGLNRLLMGSDAERVLHATPVPLLLVRGEPAAGGNGA